MKKWQLPLMEEIAIQKTENGGAPSMNFDQTWHDENKADHVNFEVSDDPNIQS